MASNMFKLSNDYADMIHTLYGDMTKVYDWSVNELKKIENSMVNRPLPFYHKVSAKVRMSGDRWMCMVVVKNQSMQRQPSRRLYMPFGEGKDTGVVLFMISPDAFNFDFTFVLFRPHCVDRYRQRQLEPNGINVSKDEQIDRMIISIAPHSIAMDGGVVTLMTEQGAFFGYRLSRDFVQFNTFIAYKDAYLNQRAVLDHARDEISRMQDMLANNEMPLASSDETINGRDATRQMIKKSGMYYEIANKKADEVKEQRISKFNFSV